MLDLIGDIHGHADKLEALLQKMGYTNNTARESLMNLNAIGEPDDEEFPF